MEHILNILQAPFLLLGALLSGYLVVLTIAAIFGSRRPKPSIAEKKLFAIIIPAHNEEKVIRQTLQSIREVWYPENKFDVIVVADNCSDRTARIAMETGAIVFERFDPQKRGKGYALNWILPQIVERMPKYDAVILIDADSIISTNFLEEMNTSLHEGKKVIQCSNMVLENLTSWRVQLMLIAIALFNYVRPLGKSALGLSVALKGNGMCFASDVLRKLRWDESSLGEDLDMGLDLIKNGFRVDFNPRASMHALMPTMSSSATTQRLRWEGGRFRSTREKVPGLVRQALRERSFYIFEAALDAAFPPLALFVMIVLGFVAINFIFYWMGMLSSTMFMLAWLAVLGGLTVHCVLGIMIARVHPRSLLAMLHLPTYILWKTGVYIRLIIDKLPKEWVRTGR